jgi:GT2 family glycosyltransferase
VAHVRNALIASALDNPETGFLALLDDDEWPEPEWLEELLDMQRRTGADAVGGAMSPAFPIAAPSWAEQLDLYRQEHPDGLTDMLWGTCNVLLTRRCLETIPRPWFDEEFGLTGGEDVEFFTRLKATGATFAWAGAARVFEDVPRSRLKLRWIARRSFRIGNTNARTQLRWRYNRMGRLAILVKAVGRLLTAAALTLPSTGWKAQYVEALCLSCRSFGEVTALLGIRYREYG